MASNYTEETNGSSLDSTSLRQRLVEQRSGQFIDDDSVSSIDSSEMVGQINTIMQEPKFKFTDIFSPKLIILFLWRTFHRATFGTICVFVLLWASIFSYISFYYIYVPALDVSHSIHFQFDAVCKDTCSGPYANILLSHYKSPSFFAKGQSYKVRLDLAMPESDINWDQGMFMVKINLQDNQNKFIASSARPAILKYKSPLLRYLSIAVYWPLLVTGLKQETQHMSITLIEDYTDGVKPNLGTATNARVELEARMIQIYHSTLVIQANLTGLRFFMVNWPFLTALIGTATIFGFLSMITICGVYRIVNEDRDSSEFSDRYEFDNESEANTYDDQSTVASDEPDSPDSTT